MSESTDKIKGSALTAQESGKSEPPSRRIFLTRSGAAAVGLATLPTAGMAVGGASAAPNLKSLREQAGKTLVRMARDIFPHDKVPDKFYVAAIAPYDEKAASDAALKKLLDDGIEQLNAAAMARHGKPYADVPGEGERAALLYEIEQSAFFQKVRGDLVFGLYDNKEVWPLFGYEGSSWEKGGYINRGFNDINWLPKAAK